MSGLGVKIGDIVWRKDGFGVQKITNDRFSPTYKVWVSNGDGVVCIDRFFSMNATVRFIRKSGGLVFTRECPECQ